ncbi:hypothetical protein SAMN05661080_03199 [Modestobacter sp. DSM 44400]|uniref:hypothetical protein n=1 Tax=Modestobacter sp. DSM 44400 TaxID=1550230 RepID=UPI00089A1D94|nr:hypothetical protein [Modestobacter sp. DSM 44400]SDY35617.1 hypothetical protein SAMN05661080_03199 [Modestobacter sp. DSM 44400]
MNRAGDEKDSYAWKKFNSANAGGNVPTLTFSYDGWCDQYNGNTVCGGIRDKYYSLGGEVVPGLVEVEVAVPRLHRP